MAGLIDMPVITRITSMVMPVGSALILFLSGASLWLFTVDIPYLKVLRLRVAYLFSLVILALSLCVLAGILPNPDIIDFPLPLSFAFYGTLTGLSLLLIDLETRRGYRPAQYLAFGSGTLALLAFIGHIYGLYGLRSYTGMAWPASILGLSLGVGLLCARSHSGMMAIVTNEGPGGVMARRLLLGIIGIPSVLGILRLEGERQGLYDAQRGVALLIVLIIVSFMIMIWWYAHSLNLTDAERRKAEEARRDTERELEAQRVLSIRVDRLRSLGEMAAGIAHELNQPLVGVRGLAEHLLLGLERGWVSTEVKVSERLKLIIEQADRMTHIIQHVRLFSREAGKPETEAVNLNAVVEAATGMLDAQFQARGIDLTSELSSSLPMVAANPYSVEEVLINLLINARDATEDQLAGDYPPESPSVHVLTRETSGQVILEVQDQGGGIPEGIIPRVFDPFFTTKDPERGTGLGLAVCKSLVEQFGGTIDIQSTIEQGTTITVALPAIQHPSKKEA